MAFRIQGVMRASDWISIAKCIHGIMHNRTQIRGYISGMGIEMQRKAFPCMFPSIVLAVNHSIYHYAVPGHGPL